MSPSHGELSFYLGGLERQTINTKVLTKHLSIMGESQGRSLPIGLQLVRQESILPSESSVHHHPPHSAIFIKDALLT